MTLLKRLSLPVGVRDPVPNHTAEEIGVQHLRELLRTVFLKDDKEKLEKGEDFKSWVRLDRIARSSPSDLETALVPLLDDLWFLEGFCSKNLGARLLQRLSPDCIRKLAPDMLGYISLQQRRGGNAGEFRELSAIFKKRRLDGKAAHNIQRVNLITAINSIRDESDDVSRFARGYLLGPATAKLGNDQLFALFERLCLGLKQGVKLKIMRTLLAAKDVISPIGVRLLCSWAEKGPDVFPLDVTYFDTLKLLEKHGARPRHCQLILALLPCTLDENGRRCTDREGLRERERRLLGRVYELLRDPTRVGTAEIPLLTRLFLEISFRNDGGNQSILHLRLGDQSLETRVLLYRAALRIGLENPLVGASTVVLGFPRGSKLDLPFDQVFKFAPGDRRSCAEKILPLLRLDYKAKFGETVRFMRETISKVKGRLADLETNALRNAIFVLEPMVSFEANEFQTIELIDALLAILSKLERRATDLATLIDALLLKVSRWFFHLLPHPEKDERVVDLKQKFGEWLPLQCIDPKQFDGGWWIELHEKRVQKYY